MWKPPNTDVKDVPYPEFQNRGSGAGTEFWKREYACRLWGQTVLFAIFLCLEFPSVFLKENPWSPAQRPGRLAVGLLSPLEGPPCPTLGKATVSPGPVVHWHRLSLWLLSLWSLAPGWTG